MPLVEIEPTHPLYDAAMKLERARVHLDELDREVDRFLEKDVYSAASTFDEARDLYVFSLKPILAPPPIFGNIVGDIVHNLRATLDYLICQLALLDGTGRPCNSSPRTQFPIVDTEPAWSEEGTQRMISRLSSKAVARVQAVQPYHATDAKQLEQHTLRVLRELSNTDKHRNVNAAPLVIEFDVRTTTPPRVVDGAFQVDMTPDVFAAFDVRRDLRTEIAFELEGPANGTNVKALRSIHELIRNIVLPQFVEFFPQP